VRWATHNIWRAKISTSDNHRFIGIAKIELKEIIEFPRTKPKKKVDKYREAKKIRECQRKRLIRRKLFSDFYTVEDLKWHKSTFL